MLAVWVTGLLWASITQVHDLCGCACTWSGRRVVSTTGSVCVPSRRAWPLWLCMTSAPTLSTPRRPQRSTNTVNCGWQIAGYGNAREMGPAPIRCEKCLRSLQPFYGVNEGVVVELGGSTAHSRNLSKSIILQPLHSHPSKFLYLGFTKRRRTLSEPDPNTIIYLYSISNSMCSRSSRHQTTFNIG